MYDRIDASFSVSTESRRLFALVVRECVSCHNGIADQDTLSIHGNVVRVLVSVKMIRAAREPGRSTGQLEAAARRCC